MIHVFDQDFDQKVAEPFHETYMAHTSTSPNYQILASLDLGRRQVALEGVELVQRQIENAMQLRDAIDNHLLLSKYMACLRTSDLIPDEFRPSHIAQPLRSGLIHGYQPDFGYRVYTEKAIEMCRPADVHATNGHQPLPAEPQEPMQRA